MTIPPSIPTPDVMIPEDLLLGILILWVGGSVSTDTMVARGKDLGPQNNIYVFSVLSSSLSNVSPLRVSFLTSLIGTDGRRRET